MVTRRVCRAVLAALCVVAALRSGGLALRAQGTFPQTGGGTAVRVTGIVSELHVDDVDNRRSEVVTILREAGTGRTFTLRFERGVRRIRPGSAVTVRGRAQGSVILLRADDPAAVSTQESSGQSAIDVPIPVGDQATLVVVANLLDAAVPSSVPQISDMMFGEGRSVAGLYREMSGGRLSVSGKVVGPLTINRMSTDECDLNAIGDAIDQAAAQAVDITAYVRKVYVLPSAGCGGAGIAEFGVTPSRAWIFFSNIADLFAHEFGHNLGLHHAATFDNEYGDNTTIMGLPRNRLRPVGAPQKVQMGWVGGTITAVSTPGDFQLAPLDLPTAPVGQLQVLLIPRAGTNDRYYVAYRRGLGYNADGYEEYIDRLSVHLWSGGATRTFFLAALGDGETYSDPATGFSVTQVQHSDNASTARISLGDTCIVREPSVAVAPLDQVGPPGAAAIYTVNIVNNDSAQCAPSVVSLSAIAPSGWTGSLAPSGATLSPGASMQSQLTVSVPTDAAPGAQRVSVRATSPAPHNATADASYTVVRRCDTAPALSVTPIAQTGGPGSRIDYMLSIRNQDDSGCATVSFNPTPAVPTGWQSALSAPSIQLAPGASSAVRVSITSSTQAQAGTYSARVDVADAVRTHAASVAVAYVVDTTDATPPSAPTALTVVTRRNQITLTWRASTDNFGVMGYRILRDGSPVALTTSTSWVDGITLPGTYVYSVTAHDAAGNTSVPSAPVSVTLKRGKGK